MKRIPNMALNREGFKDKLEEYLGGARGEFYKARAATKNGKHFWVDQWLHETAMLIDRALEVFTDRPIRGFKNRDLAFSEVLTHLMTYDGNARVRATNTVLRDYDLTRLAQPLSEEDTAAFWKLVATIAEASPGKPPEALLRRK